VIVPVELGARRYEVLVGDGVRHELAATLAAEVPGAGRAAIVTQAGIGVEVDPGMPAEVFTVPDGEGAKSLPVVEDLCRKFAVFGLSRSDVVVAVGGGVVTDLAGFAAASFHRGTAYVNVATPLLGQVDAAIGGKTGVNLPEGKNLAGAFHQPRLVVADLDTLDTLPLRELAAGMAEVVKYGIIADPALFRSLRTGDVSDLGAIVRRCVEIKAEVVADDERETTGRRATLNFGHTLGHAIENAGGYGKLLHGEAISIGMRAAAHLSHKKVGLSLDAVHEIEATLAAQGLPLHAPDLDRAKIGQALKLDKKGANQWVLAPEIGRTVLTGDVTAGDVEALLDLVSTPPAS